MEIDSTITTLRDFRHATKEETNDLQIYVETESGNLIEITEVVKILAKAGDKPYLILRAR